MTDWLQWIFARCTRAPRDYEWFDIGQSPLLGYKFPVVCLTRELIEDAPHIRRMNPWYTKIGKDFDSDCEVWAWWVYAPVFYALWWWKNSRWRYIAERTLSGRVADKPEGTRWTAWDWRFRRPSAWTWRHTRPLSRRTGAEVAQ